jgi:hypothetical protein
MNQWPRPWFVYWADGNWTVVLEWPYRTACLPFRRWPACDTDCDTETAQTP